MCSDLLCIAWKLSEQKAPCVGTTPMEFCTSTNCPPLSVHTQIIHRLPLLIPFLHPKVLIGINSSWNKRVISSRQFAGSLNRFVRLKMGSRHCVLRWLQRSQHPDVRR